MALPRAGEAVAEASGSEMEGKAEAWRLSREAIMADLRCFVCEDGVD